MTKLSRLLLAAAAFAAPAFAQVTPFSVNADADGFTGWISDHSTVNGSQAGNFISAATGANELGSQIAVNGKSWGLYSNSGQTAALIYNFGASLAAGESVSIAMDNGFIDTNGVVGFSLQNSSGTNRFEWYYIGGHAVNSYKINDGVQEDVLPNIGFTAAGLTSLQFTQLPGNSYSFAVNGSPILNTGLALNGSDISRIRIFSFNAGSGGSNDSFFNSLQVIPEPSTYAGLLGAAALSLALWRRTRKS